jgi:hypothetical protein
MRYFFIILLLSFNLTNVLGQDVYLVKGKRRVQLKENTFIGLTTNSDTIKYGSGSYETYQIHTDSIVLRKPSTFKDSMVKSADVYTLPADYLIGKSIKENNMRYYEVKKILSFENKSFSYKDITTMTYVIYNGRMDGCIFCILVPGLNIWWLITILNKKEKTLDMKKWSIVAGK